MKNLLRPVFRPLVAVSLAAVMTTLLAGCGSPATDGTQGGYISGGSDTSKLIVSVPSADRKPAPEISGEDLNGNPVSTADWAGKIVVVNLWGSWCPPCREEAPALDKVARATKADGVEFLGIAQREDAGTTLAFTRNHKISYPSISDSSGRLTLGFATSLPAAAIPTTWIIDAKGRVAARILDVVTEKTLTGLIEDVRKGTS